MKKRPNLPSYPKEISREQGDNNTGDHRNQYLSSLDDETRYWLERDANIFLHQALSTPVMNVLAKTEGAWIEDLSGKRYLDLHGNGVHNAGFSNPDIIAAAIRQLESSLAFTPRRYTNLPAIQLAEKLIEITPADLTRVLFCPGGSEAVEMALALAKHITGRWKTISYWDSYHGNGYQAASVGGEEHFSNGMGPMVPGAFHVEFPNYYRNPWKCEDRQTTDELYVRQLELILKRNPDVAAIMAEPVSATPVIASGGYWNRIRELCDEHGILLIFDEIIEGMGRTGKWFACEHFLTPDVLVLGKSLGGGLLPLAGIVTKEEFNVLGHRSIGHYTHEKNPLSASVGLATIEYMEQQAIVENAARMGTYLLEKLTELQDRFPVIGHVAGLGLHIGVDLVKDRTTKERAVTYAERIMYECLKMGVSFKVIEGNVLTFRPSLIVTKDECDLIIQTLREAFERNSIVN